MVWEHEGGRLEPMRMIEVKFPSLRKSTLSWWKKEQLARSCQVVRRTRTGNEHMVQNLSRGWWARAPPSQINQGQSWPWNIFQNHPQDPTSRSYYSSSSHLCVGSLLLLCVFRLPPSAFHPHCTIRCSFTCTHSRALAFTFIALIHQLTQTQLT